LAALANGAIDDVPRMLREVDVVTFRDPLREVQIFLNYCKWLVEQMKSLIDRARN